MPKPSITKFVWPFKGVVDTSAYQSQPEQTTYDALNVRPFDALENRMRGGKRPGLEKFVDAQVNGSASIQFLLPAVEAVPLTVPASFGTQYAAQTSFDDTDHSARSVDVHPDGDRVVTGYVDSGDTDNMLVVFEWDDVSGWGGAQTRNLSNVHTQTLLWHPDGDVVAVTQQFGNNPLRVAAYPYSKASGIGTPIEDFTPGDDGAEDIAWHPSGDYLAVAIEGGDENGNAIHVYPFDKSTGFGTPIKPTPVGEGGFRTVWSHDGRWLAFIYTGNILRVVGFDPDAGSFTGAVFDEGGGNPASGPSVQFSPDDRFIAVGDSGSGAPVSVWPFDSSSGLGAVLTVPDEHPSLEQALSLAFSPDGKTILYVHLNHTQPSVVGATSFDGSVLGEYLGEPATAPVLAGSPPPRHNHTAWNADGTVAFVTPGDGELYAWRFNKLTRNSTARETTVVAVSAGDIKRSDPDFSGYSLMTGGSAALDTTGPVDGTVAFQNAFFADGRSDYKYLALQDDGVFNWWDNLRAGKLPVGATGNSYDITGVDTTANEITVAEDVSGEFSAGDLIEITGSTGNDGAYKLFSVSGSGPTTLNIEGSFEDDTADGQVAKADIGCRIIATYRGRVVLAGLRTDPQNWFMSAAGDPFDFDYSPAITTDTQAVAGNNANSGKLGDVLTALIPFNDDVLIFGGAKSIWMMRGDPAAGGQIDNIARNLGIVGADAWTFDTRGILYFLSHNGLYRMSPTGSGPEPVNQGKLDEFFGSIDHSVNILRLEYDPVSQGIHIFQSPQAEPDSPETHLWWDERTESFWKEQYPTNTGPSATVYLSTDNPTKRGVLLGGYDGYIRGFNRDATDDDGTAITSRIRFPALYLGDVFASMRIDDVQVVTDRQSGDVSFKLFTGNNAEEAHDNADADTPRVQQTLVGGRAIPVRKRLAQNTVVPVIEQTSSSEAWAYEGGGATVSTLNRMRGKRVT